MHPRLRFWLIVSLGLIVSTTAAVAIAQESYFLATVTSGVLLWLMLEWWGGPWPESWLLAGALAGYVLANRGFAQLSFAREIPLLPAELVLMVGVTAGIFRMALRATAAVKNDGLNIAVLVWMALGASRLWMDVREFGAVALRDFATVYYAVFFFLAQAMATHEPSRRLVRVSLLAACAILPISYQLFTYFGDYFFRYLVFRGVPLVFYKDDLIAAYLFAGFFLVFTAGSWPGWLRVAIAGASYATAFSINSSRAAIVGLLLTNAWWAVARRWVIWKWQAAFVSVGVFLLIVLAMAKNEPYQGSRAYALYEHVASMVDISGTRRYSHIDRQSVGDNNRFRLVWWRSVVEEMWHGGPMFGLGFGYDLSTRFLRNYDLDLGDEFTTRSPHSIVFTVLGRMGLVGFVAWLAVIGGLAQRTLRLARRAKSDDAVLPALGWWSAVWVMFGSACFGVVLEGPMGAIVFWTSAGFANALTAESAQPLPAPIAVEPAETEPATVA